MTGAASRHETQPRVPPDPSDPAGGDGLAEALAGPDRVLTLEEWAAALGGLRYVELALFELLGRAALGGAGPGDAGPGGAGPGGAGYASWAGGASLQAAWRAEQIERLLPVSVGLPPAGEVTVAPSEQVASALEALGLLSGPELAAKVGATWYPALLAAYRRRSEALSEAADGPHGLVLVRVIADLEAAASHLADLPRRAPGPCEGA